MSIRCCGCWLLITAALARGSAPLEAAEPSGQAAPKPVPAVQVLPLPNDEAAFEHLGRELARYHFAAGLHRPFVYPLIGPAGRSLTRMGHPRDPIGHSHHNSFWVSHNKVDGVDFWGDRGQGRIEHQRIEQYEDTDSAAWLVALNAWTRLQPREVLLVERRRIQVEPLKQGEWLLTLDLELAPAPQKHSVTLDKSPFGLVGVRMAKSIGVHDGGGRILNSSGGVNEKEVFWKPARWCDYSGPITPAASEGIALLDHPYNPNHPTVFHVRDDGWMGASLTFDAPRTIEAARPLRLRYGLWIHAGVPSVEQLDERWQAFARTEPPPTLAPQKPAK